MSDSRCCHAGHKRPDLRSECQPIGIDTLVQLAFLARRGLIANVMTHQSNSGREGDLGDLLASAERKLGAFIKAVTDSFGTVQAGRAAEDWLEELESMPLPNELTSCRWRAIRITAAARLAVRLNTAPSNTKVSPIRSPNCSVQELLA